MYSIQRKALDENVWSPVWIVKMYKYNSNTKFSYYKTAVSAFNVGTTKPVLGEKL